MPTLENPRYEAFAQARAKGALLIDAYESAGFVRHRGHPSRLAWKPEVAERIAELRALQTDMEDVTPMGLLASLRRIIKAGENSENPTLVNAARLAILDASRLQAELAKARSDDTAWIREDFNDFAGKDLGDEPPEGRPQAPRMASKAPARAPADSPSAPRQRPTIAQQAAGRLLGSAARSPLGLPGHMPEPPPISTWLKTVPPSTLGQYALAPVGSGPSGSGPGRSPPPHALSAGPR